MQQIIVDCASGEAQYAPLSAAEQAALASAGAAAQQQAAAAAAELAWCQLQRSALAGVRAALHDQSAHLDAAALSGLVHKLVADPPQPLSAPEGAALARFMLRALLP